jgi:hypothetical protein
VRRACLLALLLPLAARADLVLSVVNGNTETPLGLTYSMGPILAGDSITVLLSLRNTASPSVSVTRFNVDQPAFQLNAPSTPFNVAPGIPSAVTLSFSASMPGSYTANLRLNDRVIALSGTVLATSLLTVSPGCPGGFGIVVRGQSRDCAFEVRNGAGIALSIAVAGIGFASNGAANVNAGQTLTVTVRFQPANAGNYSGSLSIGPLNFPLTGQGVNPPVPTPVFDYQSTPAASAQQRRLSARLPSPSPVAGSGTVWLNFVPNPGLADDAAIAFLQPLARSLPFTVQEGSTDVLLGGQAFAVFQTGTTAGQIRFSMTSALLVFASDPSGTLTIPPSAVAIDSAFGTRGAGELQVKIVGFDNTYTTGAMSFTFYDAAGGAITAPIAANFTQAFRTFYGSSQSGSMFQVIVKFPVTGNINAIAGVEAELTNTAGMVRTARLGF